jgi:heptosyltransferase-2
MRINQNCRHFNSDVPCVFHKQEGVHCDNCSHYQQVECKILIIKLDAIGDVLRTTCILPGLKEKYPNAHITWLTLEESLSLFTNNPYVDVVLSCSYDSFIQLQVEMYDLVINLDSAPKSAQLATLAKGKEKLGFGYDERGFVYPFNKEAQKWFEMGLFDDVKKANIQTYQQIILDICRLTPSNYDIIFKLSDEEKAFADNFAKKHNITHSPVIGLNTGAGKRWKQKKWTQAGFLELIRLIQSKIPEAQILLLGGPEEVKRNRYLLEKSSGRIIDTGCNNTIREFGALLNLCDIIVTGDTFALHIALGLGKKVVVLVGPTSAQEIELYGRGKKIFAQIDCLSCYNKDCDKKPNCMDLITPEKVFMGIRELL